ncbi:gas vesicle protein GvpG [Promicromonospora soli]|uniref:Gas vesicle protein n=1 Tax=Promicromonospora soli TaxID=2035533 RepID=A0A919L2G4_9MICO|nr:gas vesicle protein GvpG [Promicromonospora soli]GHH80366.1 gas vesicle protein [Promicromonospora soli]
MGLLGALFGLPLAPVRGVAWIADQVLQEAEREYYDPSAIRRQLEEVAQARERGEIDDTEADALEQALVARLVEGRRRKRQGGP